MTRRQEIIRLLEEGPWSLQHLANHFRTTVKDILLDFNHIPKSIAPRKLGVKPAFCESCGFVFKDRMKLSVPSKCPRCKSEGIVPQQYSL
jgi:predicted Zn-ribbon and HTH transcriptional regulator